MRVVIYVEGPSDRSSMEDLLRPLIEQKLQQGVEIRFIHLGINQQPKYKGDGKDALLKKLPDKAANAILGNPDLIAVAMPDLYPPDKVFPHRTWKELEKGILNRFEEALKEKRGGDDIRIKERFKVFCFKYDLEVLVLASEEALKDRLGIKALNISWQNPVEDQNHDKPPSKVVEELFKRHGQKYVKTVDGPIILSKSDYRLLAEKCPQCFKPFVEFLDSL
jgi:hypothetical protein